MSADIRPDQFMIVNPRPKADIWVHGGEVITVLITDCPQGMALDADKSFLMFGPEFDVTVHEVHP